MSDKGWEETRHRGVLAARDLRRRSTHAEKALWDILRGQKVSGLKFRRQHPVGGWVLDFACPEHCLAVEIDGPIHDIQQEDDLRRTESLQEMGYSVIRFTNDQIFNQADFVIASILESIRPPRSQSK